jgi:enoyl-CoA hydratase/carnithine racemase
MDFDFEHLRCEQQGGRLDVTIDAPPMNIMTVELFGELDRLSRQLADASAGPDGPHVLVLRSADPDFFIAHFDVERLIVGSRQPAPSPLSNGDELRGFHRMCERYRTMPVISIAEIAGRVGGGGAELAASLDMRFGARHRMVLNQMEVPLGILPGGSGTQRIPHLVGLGRAMEIVIGAVDVDADTAAEWGWLNRSLPSVDLQRYVDDLADRIASFDPAAVRAAKASVVAALPDPEPGLRNEANLFDQLLHRPEATAAMTGFMKRGGQTRDGEQRVAELGAGLFPSTRPI